MIKTTLISLAALSGVGTSAMATDTIKPKAIELAAGKIMLSFDESGISTEVVETPDYALRLKTQKGRVIAVRF